MTVGVEGMPKEESDPLLFLTYIALDRVQTGHFRPRFIQRILSARGKQQASKIGALFAARAAPIERVLSSRYCRCLDTARIAFEAEPELFAPLDLPKGDDAQKAAQIAAIMKEIRAYSGSDNLVMVTHLEDIVALTGVSPREGEAVVVEPQGDSLRVLGRVTF